MRMHVPLFLNTISFFFFCSSIKTSKGRKTQIDHLFVEHRCFDPLVFVGGYVFLTPISKSYHCPIVRLTVLRNPTSYRWSFPGPGDSGYPLYSKQKDESSSDWTPLQGNPGIGFCFCCRKRCHLTTFLPLEYTSLNGKNGRTPWHGGTVNREYRHGAKRNATACFSCNNGGIGRRKCVI